MTRYEDHVRECLRRTRRHRADSRLAHELDVDARLRVGALEVEDELLEVLDGVDVVVRRRRDQPHPGGRVTRASHPRVHLRGRQLAALTGLRTLRELDLDVVGLREVEARDPEATRCHLLDRTAPFRVHETVDVFAALAGVGLAADAVHRDRQRLVRFLRNRAVAHRAGLEALDDRRDRLDLIDRNGRALVRAQPEEASQRLQLGGLVVDELRVLAEDVVSTGPGRVLQPEHRVGVEQVRRTVAAPLVLPAGPQPLVGAHRSVLGIGVLVSRRVLGRDDLESDAPELGLGAGEVLVDELLREADGLEHLCAGVGGHRRDAHLGHDLQHALAEGLDEVRDRLGGGDAGDVAGAHEVLDGLHRQIGIDRRGAVSDEGRDVMHLAHVSRLDDEARLHARLLADEVVVHGGQHQQGRDGREVLVGVTVAQHDVLRAVLDRAIGFGAHLLEALAHALLPRLDPVEAADGDGAASGHGGVDVLDLGQLVVVDHREVEGDGVGVVGSPRQQVPLRSQPERQRRDDLFADRVERRVRHLGELLGEVVEQQTRAVAEHGDRRVRAHGAERLGTVLPHRGQQDAHFLLGVAERALTTCDRGDRVHDVLALGKLGQPHASGVEPLLPGVETGELRLDLLVLDDAALRRVHEEHMTGLEAAATLDALGLEVEHARLAADHDESVGRLRPTAGAQTVAVERGADDRAVGEDQGRRPVPRLHLDGVVVVERAELRVHVGLLLIRLRHHHEDRVRERATGEREKLQDLVERGRIARAVGADGQQRTHVADEVGLELRLPGAHPVAVAVDRVDLTVVREHPERLRERP